MLTHVWHLLVNLSTLRTSEYDLISGKVASLVGCYILVSNLVSIYGTQTIPIYYDVQFWGDCSHSRFWVYSSRT
jgi:hypothetical protein